MKELVEEMLDNEYGCAVANRFGGLLDDESDPFDVLYQTQLQQERKKKDEPKKPPVKAGKKARPAVSDRESAANTKAVSGQKRPVRLKPEEKAERRVHSEAKLREGDYSLGYSIEKPVELFDRAGRGRGSGRGRGLRGGGYPRSTDGFDPRGKREFERHSGSDKVSVRPEEKRRGNGSRNWGSLKDRLGSAVTDDLPNESGEEVDTTETTGENKPVVTEEMIEVAIEMSLDEWKTLQEQSRPKAEFNIRKADTKVPSKAVVIHKSKRFEEQGNEINEGVVSRRPVNDITFQMEINFGSLDRPSRGGRGGRRGRGSGAVATQRSLEKIEPAPNPDDPEDFPALA